MTAILGYLVNSAVRTLLFGYFTAKFIAPVCISRWRRWHRTYALVPG